MKKVIKITMMLLVLVAMLVSMGCMTKVKAGYVGVKVNLYGDEKGVQNKVVSAGRYFESLNVEYYKYPTFTNMYPFTATKDEGSPTDESFSFQTKEGVKCSADIGVQCKADPAKANVLFQTYREDMESIIKKYVRADIRDAMNKSTSELSVDSLYGMGKNTLMVKINKMVKAKYEGSGLIIENITLLSDIRFPQEITNGIVAKMGANQRAMQRENELREARAMADKKVIEANAEAMANRAKMQTITPQLIEWERMQMTKQFIDKWNGSSVPQYMGNGGNFNMLFNSGK